MELIMLQRRPTGSAEEELGIIRSIIIAIKLGSSALGKFAKAESEKVKAGETSSNLISLINIPTRKESHSSGWRSVEFEFA